MKYAIDNKGEKICSAYNIQLIIVQLASEISSYSSLGIVKLKGTPGSIIDLTFQPMSTFHETLDRMISITPKQNSVYVLLPKKKNISIVE